MAAAEAETPAGSITGAACGFPEGAVAAFRSVIDALQRPGGALQVQWLLQQRKHRLGALQEQHVAPGRSSCRVQERYIGSV